MSGVYENPPFEFRLSVPCVTSVMSVAVSVSFSGSVSFIKTPGAAMFSVVSSSVV